MKKYHGKSKDAFGCEFDYTCYVGQKHYEYDANGELYPVQERIYVDDLFGNRANTLKELKEIMSAK